MGDSELDMRLSGGRSIRLRELDQWLVYEGLGDGVPTRELNTKLVASIVEASSPPGGGVVLIPPADANPGGRGDSASAIPRLLPRTVVRARFEAEVPVSGEGDYSELTLVWFQEPWALPVDPGIEQRIRLLDWEGCARNMVW